MITALQFIVFLGYLLIVYNRFGIQESISKSAYAWAGDTRYGTKYPYPLFYKGFPDDPVNDPDNLEIHHQWSTNGKIVINLGV